MVRGTGTGDGTGDLTAVLTPGGGGAGDFREMIDPLGLDEPFRPDTTEGERAGEA